MKSGVGIGFRREIGEEILSLEGSDRPDFVEIAPENWIKCGGNFRRTLKRVAEKYPILTHGLSLSLGSPEPIDWAFLREVKQFFNEFPVEIYSEHLSYCKCHNAHVYDLLPIPFQEEAITHIVDRIKKVQNFLERKIAIENVSYYTCVEAEMDEATFITQIVEESDCDLLLDVNNVYVNAFNHGYNAEQFLANLPLHKVRYIHMAGHEQRDEELIIDTHGNPIIDPVYRLLESVVKRIHPVPILLERDFNFENFPSLVEEMGMLREITARHWEGEVLRHVG